MNSATKNHNDNDMYCLRYSNGDFVAVDDTSGGYPYPVSKWNLAKFWYTIGNAQHYADMFPDKKFTVYKMRIELTHVEMP
jgi:hypothetical protein